MSVAQNGKKAPPHHFQPALAGPQSNPRDIIVSAERRFPECYSAIELRKAIVGPQRQIELNRSPAPAPRTLQATERPWAINLLAPTRDQKFRIQGEFRDTVPPSSIPWPSRRCMPSAECEDFQAGRQATKPWNRSLSTRKSNPSSPLQRVETDSDATRCFCPDRVSRRPARLPRVARNWNFESSSLQRRVMQTIGSSATEPITVEERCG